MPWDALRVAIMLLRSVVLHRLVRFRSVTTAERAPVGRGRRGRVAAQVLAQRDGAAEAAAGRDVLDRQGCSLEQAAGLEDALADQPLQRAHARLGAEDPREAALGVARAARHPGDG